MDGEQPGYAGDDAADGPGDDADDAEPLDLSKLLDLLPELEIGALMAIVAAYQAGDSDERAAARDRAVDVARRDGQAKELDEMQGSILQWAGSNLRVNDGYPTLNLGTRMLRDARVQAASALVDAAIALLLDGQLADDDRARLLEPVAAVVG